MCHLGIFYAAGLTCEHRTEECAGCCEPFEATSFKSQPRLASLWAWSVLSKVTCLSKLCLYSLIKFNCKVNQLSYLIILKTLSVHGLKGRIGGVEHHIFDKIFSQMLKIWPVDISRGGRQSLTQFHWWASATLLLARC